MWIKEAGLLIPFCDEDPVVLRDEVLNILIAGRDSVSTTFSPACMHMCLFIVFFFTCRLRLL